MKVSKRLKMLSLLLAVVTALVCTAGASAHPLGNFTISHYTEIEITSGGLRLNFILDMAEIPAFQEIALLDNNQDGQASGPELDGYPERQCQAVQEALALKRNGVEEALHLNEAAVAFPPGAGGLATLRLTCTFETTSGSPRSGDRVHFEDRSFPERLGWREIVVKPGASRLDGTFSTRSASSRLTSYPTDLLSSPLDVREVEFQVVEAAEGKADAAQQPQQAGLANILPEGRGDRFTQLITLQDLSPSGMLLALLAACVWGGLHSLTPGHGKAIVGAYLVGSRGTARHALLLGLATTITHTAGVFALGLVTLFASQTILPEQLFPWVSLLSGLMVVGIGLVMVVQRLRAAVNKKARPAHSHGPGEHHHHHEPGEDHHDHEHDHEHGHNHDHGHSHLPPESEVTWRSLIALGISGGLLPCPSALVVMLGAIALERVGFGIALVLAFSVGLAGVLTGIGLLLVYGRRLFERLPVRSRGYELIPVGSAVVVMVLGAAITMRALGQIGGM